MADVWTEDGEEYIVDLLQASAMKYIDCGEGIGGAVKGDAALGTPTGEARVSGTQGEGGSASVYRVTGTTTFAGTFAVTEVGLFSASVAGVMGLRADFAAINVVSGNGIAWTIDVEAQ